MAQTNHVRLLPALMVTAGVVLGLKAVTAAEAAGETAAKAEPAKADDAAPAKAPAPKAEPACPPPSFADQAGLSAQEVEVLQSLGARRAQLDARAAEIDTQAVLLAAAEKRVAERLAELKKVQANVDAQLARLSTMQDERVADMINVYQKMKSKDAAKIFEELEPDTLLQVAGGMKQANLAEIMGAMSPEKARKLTQMLIEERKLPPGALTAGTAKPNPAT